MKQLFLTCRQWLDNLCDKICDQIAAYMVKKEQSYREFVLEDKLNKVRTDNKFLQLQLTKTRADFYELQRRPQELRNVIAEILLMTEEQLREHHACFAHKRGSFSCWMTQYVTSELFALAIFF